MKLLGHSGICCKDSKLADGGSTWETNIEFSGERPKYTYDQFDTLQLFEAQTPC